jgi:hypothetical protein
MRIFFFAILAIGLSAAAFQLSADVPKTEVRAEASAGEKSALKLAEDKDDSTLAVTAGTQTIFRYRYKENSFKPYADRLTTPSGVQVLRDQVEDHKHHHGLMFALEVNGTNFWEENAPKSGRECHRSFDGMNSSSQDGVVRVGFTQLIQWMHQDGKTPLLVERRAIDAITADDLGATLVEWRSRLQTPEGKDSVTLTGHHYFGLGMRFLASMDKTGRFFNADGKTGETVRDDERLTPTKWCAYTAKCDGKLVTVAVFDHPKNFRFPAKKFTMATPFAYLSATINAWKEPITLKSDKPLDLTYAVAAWDGEVEPATVEKLYQRWVKHTEK